MKNNVLNRLTAALAAVPEGHLEVISRASKFRDGVSPPRSFDAKLKGKGRWETTTVFPGIEISFIAYLSNSVDLAYKASHAAVEVTYCRSGRIGWHMQDDTIVYLGRGDVSIQSMAARAASVADLPLGYYEGVTVFVDLDMPRLPELLDRMGLSAGGIFAPFRLEDGPAILPASKAMDCVFSPLYTMPECAHDAYLELKTQELLLALYNMPLKSRKTVNKYACQYTEIVKQVHDLLTSDLSRRYTIDELAKRYLINSFTLKSVFKATYGLPVAAYMRTFRIHRAAELLRTTEDSIAAIAEKVGYESQGKFSSAFKEITGILPTEYRRQTHWPGSR